MLRHKLTINGRAVFPEESFVSVTVALVKVSPSPDADGAYTANTVVTLVALPREAGTQLVWSGVDGQQAGKTTVQMTADRFPEVRVATIVAQPTPTPVPVPTPVPASTPISGPTSLPPTATAVPTLTPTPTPTPPPGSVFSWGSNLSGQLGDGTTTNRSTPGTVAGLTGVVAVTGGEDHSLALKADGTVWAWGENFAGQLGEGTTNIRSAPSR